MQFDLTDFKVREDGEGTCQECPVNVFVQHGLSPNRDKDPWPLGHVRNAMFLLLDGCVGLGNCAQECNKSLASDLCHDVSVPEAPFDILGDSKLNEEHPIIKASERASQCDPDGNLMIEHDRRKEALRKYLVTRSNPFRIQQIRSIALPAMRQLLEGMNYSSALNDDGDVVNASGIVPENGRIMVDINIYYDNCDSVDLGLYNLDHIFYDDDVILPLLNGDSVKLSEEFLELETESSGGIIYFRDLLIQDESGKYGVNPEKMDLFKRVCIWNFA